LLRNLQAAFAGHLPENLDLFRAGLFVGEHVLSDRSSVRSDMSIARCSENRFKLRQERHVIARACGITTTTCRS
jgi:hypothetical protein